MHPYPHHQVIITIPQVGLCTGEQNRAVQSRDKRW
jgi:hypothetical protein